MDERARKWLDAMTLEEKATLLGGAELWRTRPVPRVGVPRLKVSDGPTGVRGSGLSGGATAACFPCGTAIGATWNPAMAAELGAALADEARSKGAHVVLGPTVNLHRHPFGGRHFECYSEDPHLTSRLAVAFIRAMQADGVGACIKHFVCNDSEFERHTIDSVVDEPTLRELYLRPFEAAVREADVASVMGAYNRVNGDYACEHEALLRRTLKQEWEFRGFVISDWFATQSTVASARGGLDLEMPGPPRYFDEKLVEAVRAGEVPEAAIDEAAGRLLSAIVRFGADAPDVDTSEAAERAVERPAHRALARRIAADAIVLLKNEGDLLPLDPAALRRVALIGPNAGVAALQGGGSSRVNPHRAVSARAALTERLGDRLRYERGCTNHRELPPLDAETFGAETIEMTFFHADDPEDAEPVATRALRQIDLSAIGTLAPGLDAKRGFRARLRATLHPPESGVYTFSLVVGGRARLFLEGRERLENWESYERGASFYGTGSRERTAEIELEAGRAVELVIDYSSEGSRAIVGLRCGGLLPVPDDLLERAVAAAADAEVAIVVVGLNQDWETEGRDRESFALPGRQEELVRRVAEANPRTIVVQNTGAPVDVAYLADVPAALQIWYPGQEGGHALADVLLGDSDPGGRLPSSWPARVEDVPSHAHYPGGNGRVVYGEGLLMGYRGYDAAGTTPAFAFGHGLSYGRFRYGELRVAAEAGRVEVDVTNEGERAGREVVQLYLARPPRAGRPPRELKAFSKLSLQPGETRTVSFELGTAELAGWDVERGAWAVEPGRYEVSVGRSSRDLRAHGKLVIEG